MSLTVSISLPPVAGSDVCASIGTSVQYLRAYDAETRELGITDAIVEENGTFFVEEDPERISLILERIRTQRKTLSGLLDTDEHGDNTYSLWVYLGAWEDLYHSVVELRLRGVKATLFGA